MKGGKSHRFKTSLL